MIVTRGAAILYLALSLVVSSAAAATSSIVGDWFEDETYGGGRTIAVGHFKADGSFSVDFRECTKPKPKDHTEAGTWTYANGKLELTTASGAGGFLSYDVEDYQTLSNDGHLWVYKSTAGPLFNIYGPVTFRDERVLPGSKPPGCDLTS